MPTWKIAVGPVFLGAGLLLMERQPIIGWSLMAAGVATLGFLIVERRLRAALPRLRDHVHIALLLATMVAVAYDVAHLPKSTLNVDRAGVGPAVETAEVARLERALARCEAEAARAKAPADVQPMESP